MYVQQFVQANNKEYQSSALLALIEGNPPVTSTFPSQRANNVESLFMTWYHHGTPWYHKNTSKFTWNASFFTKLSIWTPVGGVTNIKSFYQKAFSRMLGHDWLMLKHQPITTKHSAKSFFVKSLLAPVPLTPVKLLLKSYILTFDRAWTWASVGTLPVSNSQNRPSGRGSAPPGALGRIFWHSGML